MIKHNNGRLISIDLGGTKVNVGLIEGAKIMRKTSAKIPSIHNDEWCVINLIIDLIKEVARDSIIEGIYIGVPSIVDKKLGIVHEVQNIPAWNEVHLVSILKNKFNQVPVLMDNDANCFTVGEYFFGLGKGCKSIVGITLGTGLGAGIISENHLINGTNGGAGEFGMIPYKDGIIEDYCSGKFFKKHNLSGEILMQKATQGDQKALALFEKFGHHLGSAIKIIMYTVNPEKVIIGGAIAKSAIFFDKALKKSISNFAYKKVLNNFKVEYSTNSDIALLGATSLSYESCSKPI